MAELARDLGVSKTTVYRAEKGKQVFNYKLLFQLVMHGASPDWLLFGQDAPSRHDDKAQLLWGEMVKRDPHELKSVGPAFDWKRPIPFPTKADEKLVRMLREVEALYLQSDEPRRDALIKLVKSLVGILGRVSTDDPSLLRIHNAGLYLKLGMVAEEEGNLEEAIKCYEAALERDPTSEARRRIASLRMCSTGSGQDHSRVPAKEGKSNPETG